MKLKDPATGRWVEDGADIPLDQILGAPKRSQLAFERSEGRSIGDMVAGKGNDRLPPFVQASGWKPAKKKGWKGLTKAW